MRVMCSGSSKLFCHSKPHIVKVFRVILDSKSLVIVRDFNFFRFFLCVDTSLRLNLFVINRKCYSVDSKIDEIDTRIKSSKTKKTDIILYQSSLDQIFYVPFFRFHIEKLVFSLIFIRETTSNVLCSVSALLTLHYCSSSNINCGHYIDARTQLFINIGWVNHKKWVVH